MKPRPGLRTNPQDESQNQGQNIAFEAKAHNICGFKRPFYPHAGLNFTVHNIQQFWWRIRPSVCMCLMSEWIELFLAAQHTEAWHLVT